MSDPQQLNQQLRERLHARGGDLQLPPPAFLAMQAEFVQFEEEAGQLAVRFPVLDHQLNPFGTMQGGFITAAVDNTIGPLSLLVAPVSITRRLEMKYSRAIHLEDGYFVVEARFVEQKKRRLVFQASVKDPRGVEVASGTAVHWIVDPDYR